MREEGGDKHDQKGKTKEMATFLPKKKIHSKTCPSGLHAYKYPRLSSAVFYATEERDERKVTGCTPSCVFHGAVCALVCASKLTCAHRQEHTWAQLHEIHMCTLVDVVSRCGEQLWQLCRYVLMCTCTYFLQVFVSIWRGCS